MDNGCDVVRDLLPLYVDGLCADGSRALVEEHIRTCPSCAKMLEQLRSSACEDSLRREARTVMAPRKWRNRVFAMACTLAGFACVPACVGAVLAADAAREPWDWLYLLAPALLVMISTTLLPLRSRYYTVRWTMLGCPASLLALLAACWVYSGKWPFGALALALYLLAAAVLVPWAVRELPLGGHGRRTAALWDGYCTAALAVSWCLAGEHPAAVTAVGVAGACLLLVTAAAVLALRLPVNGTIRAGLCAILAGNAQGWLERAVLPLTGAENAPDGTIRLAILAGVSAVGAALTAAGLWKAYRSSKNRGKNA